MTAGRMGHGGRRNARASHAVPSRKGDREGYAAVFTIPAQWWMVTDGVQSERARARTRHTLRVHARDTWRALARRGAAWHVDRFLAVIGVQYPHGRHGFPAEAAETVKPIIDAGTDVGLWTDDDSTHRCSTIYHMMPGESAGDAHVLTVLIIPVPARAPVYVAPRDINRRLLAADPTGYGAGSVTMRVPFRLWVTSNLTDSDLAARQHGRRKASTWGSWKAYGVRASVADALGERARVAWERNSMPPVPWDSYIVFAGVGYASDVNADPDNAAETVNRILHAGVEARMLPAVTPDRLKAVVFFRLAGRADPGMHDVKLYAVRIPRGVQWLDCLADSVRDSWDEWDGRHGR